MGDGEEGVDEYLQGVEEEERYRGEYVGRGGDVHGVGSNLPADRSLRANAEQQAKDGVRRNSFLAPRQDEINSMINGDLRGRARLVLTQLGEQVQEARDSGELGDDGGETRSPAPRADTPVSSAARSGRGGGAGYGEGPRDGHEATSCRARRSRRRRWLRRRNRSSRRW